jgi:hypothetical protein
MREDVSSRTKESDCYEATNAKTAEQPVEQPVFEHLKRVRGLIVVH